VLEIVNVQLGTSTGATAPQIILEDGGTLRASGVAAYGRSGGALHVAVGTSEDPVLVHINAGGATDTLTFQNSFRRVGSGVDDTFSTIRVTGLGRVIAESGGTTANTGYAGSWLVDGGILQLGPLAPGGFGTPINALGFKGGDDEAELKPNSIAINVGGILALASNDNNNASNGATSVRNPITLNGGAIATTVLDASTDGRFSGDMRFVSGSILLDDPVGTPGVARNVSFTSETGIAGNFDWPDSASLSVTGSGVLKFDRNSGTTSVGTDAVMTIGAGATVDLGGTTDPLSDGTNHVNVVNNSTTSFNITTGSKNVGNLSGTGRTTVAAGAGLTANHVRQETLEIGSGAIVTIRPNGGAAGASTLTNLLIDGGETPTGTLDLADNDLTLNQGGPATLATVKAQIRSAYAGGLWNGTGITTLLSEITTGPFAGKTAALGYEVGDTSTSIKYTFAGDAQLDGDVDLDDVGPWSTNFTGELGGSAGATKVWSQGDWDYDGDVDLDDVGKWSVNFTGELGGNGLGPAGQTLYLGDALSSVNPTALAALNGMGITVVPEPSALALLATMTCAIAARRRRVR
jgi:hypothetical protein